MNELSANALYDEGSVLARLLMGTVGLAPVRANRVLVVGDAHEDSLFSDELLNAVNAARSSFALACQRAVLLDPPLPVESVYARSGRATGHVRELERLFAVLDRYRSEYDAVALSTQVRVDPRTRTDYYGSRGVVLNPWGGAEAILTHAVSALYGVPAAHSPMFESRDIAVQELGPSVRKLVPQTKTAAPFVVKAAAPGEAQRPDPRGISPSRRARPAR